MVLGSRCSLPKSFGERGQNRQGRESGLHVCGEDEKGSGAAGCGRLERTAKTSFGTAVIQRATRPGILAARIEPSKATRIHRWSRTAHSLTRSKANASSG